MIIAYYLGVAIAMGIIFFILRAISVVFLERKQRKLFLKINPNATSQGIDKDFQQYFRKIKTKLYITLVIIVILIYIIVSK